MATSRRNTTNYRTYGNVAYVPAHDGAAIPLPRREGRRAQPKHREQTRTLTRTRVRVREAGEVAPFAVVGFLAVAVFAAMLLLSYVQYTVLSGDVVSLRGQLTALETEQVTLGAQYEQIFDMATIQSAVGDTMIRPTGDQIVYLDLSQPDSVIIYGQEKSVGGLAGALQGFGTVIQEIIEYFR